MAITEAFTGSQDVSTSEWSMTTDSAGPDTETSDGVFQAFVDLNAAAAGDRFEFRLYEKAQSGDTQRLAYREVFDGAQTEPLFISPSFVLINGWDMTLLKIAGTDRTITWSIRKIA